MQQDKMLDASQYDQQLLDAADQMQGGSQKLQISLRKAKRLYVLALNGGTITAASRASLLYILEHYQLHLEARTWLHMRMSEETPIQQSIKRTIREAAAFPNLNWVIADEEVTAQEALSGEVSLLNALLEVLHSFVHRMESSYSVRDIFSDEYDLELEADEMLTEYITEAIDNGTVYLFPQYYQAAIRDGNFPLHLNDFTHSPATHWMFGLVLPSLPDYEFTGYVKRDDAFETYVEGWAIGEQATS
ncbi:MAG: hypothetical protein AAF738_11170 [Bacteroidota bacterium]